MKKRSSPTAAFATSVILAVSGCAAPSDIVASNPRGIGSGPTNYRQVVQAYMAPRLVDPPGARYEAWEGPVATYFWVQGESGVGWRVDVSIDDKDPAGNYPAGLKRYRFVLSDGRVVSQEELQGADCVGPACPLEDNGVGKPRPADEPAHSGSNSDHAAGDKPDPPSHSTF